MCELISGGLASFKSCFWGFLSCLRLPLSLCVWRCGACKGEPPPPQHWHSQTHQPFRQRLHWTEMKTEKCTREACLWASLWVKARASQLEQWIQTRPDDINSSGKAQTLEISKGPVDRHTHGQKPCRYILITYKEIRKNVAWLFTEHYAF